MRLSIHLDGTAASMSTLANGNKLPVNTLRDEGVAVRLAGAEVFAFKFHTVSRSLKWRVALAYLDELHCKMVWFDVDFRYCWMASGLRWPQLREQGR